MSLRRLLLRSLTRFWKTNLGVAVGLAVAATVITGALVIGDSMRYSLQQIAAQRLGLVNEAVIGGDRFFTADFATGLTADAGAAIMLEGVVSTPDDRARANSVTIVGSDAASTPLIGLPEAPAPGKAMLNTQLAQQLGASVGDTLIVRVPEPSALPIDAALVNASKPALAIRVEVAGIVANNEGGRFSLRAEQREPMSLFVDHAWLAEQLELQGKANLALAASAPAQLNPTLQDLELSLRQTPQNQAELISPRIFLDSSIERDLDSFEGQRLLTYMINTITHGDALSPYAMVCASDRLGGLELSDNEIAINTWLAEDIGAAVGDTLELTYYLPDEGDKLIEAKTSLTVARIVPIEGVFADRTLTPDFPGLAEAETLSRWDAGPAIDRSLIRDKDDDYWSNYRATPKAFINLSAGQRLWANRFGTLTAIRFDQVVEEDAVLAAINPAELGIVSTDLRGQAEQAAVGTVDFGQLFLSLSGFIIIAAVLLAATLFVMSAEQRAKQLGLLLAIGLTRQQVTRLMIAEALIVALLGVVLGCAGGVGYAYAVLGALSGIWSGAIAGTAVQPYLSAASLVTGPIGTVMIGVVVIAVSVRLLAKRPARELLAGTVGKVSARPRIGAWAWAMLGVLLVLGGFQLAFIQRLNANMPTGMIGAMMGFGAGAMMLGGLMCLLTENLIRFGGGRKRKTHARPMPTFRFVVRNLTRRRGRTLASVGALSCGLFLVIAVSGFRLGAVEDPADPKSGTGGFALIVESSQPIRYDLNTPLGRDHYDLTEAELPSGSVVPFRVSSGDDASCLNLNQTPSPRLLGVDPALLASRDAFSFMQTIAWEESWDLLALPGRPEGAIPAIADANTAQWALRLAVGDTMVLTDERGQAFTIELVGTIENTILQGSLIISEDHFKQLYPSTSGHRMLLVDVDGDGAERDEVASLLSEVLIDEGVQITPTADRLAAYSTVQNTYLSIFQSLGGLGVVLGAMGLGVIAARDLLERRSELALLYAVGVTRQQIHWVVLIEKGLVLLLGLVLGILSAAVATLHTGQPLGGAGASSLATVLAALGAGMIAVLLGVKASGLRRLPRALRSE